MPETAHWLADYLHELTMFPAGRYDDQVDSTATALAWTQISTARIWVAGALSRSKRASGTTPGRIVSRDLLGPNRCAR